MYPTQEERVQYGLERARRLFDTDQRKALGTCLNIILTTDPDQPPKNFFSYFHQLEPSLDLGFETLQEQIEQLFSN